MIVRLRSAITCVAAVVMIGATVDVVRGQQSPVATGQGEALAGRQAEAQDQIADGPLARSVRQSTAALRDVSAAVAAGYAQSGGCVSGPEEGAMGVHYVNATLAGDGLLDATKPEALVFEPRNGRLQLAAVEFIVLAEQWDANNEHPPVLQGQHFHYVPAPNRAGLPAYYELHVWAWRANPRGAFADWNPRVSCDSYVQP